MKRPLTSNRRQFLTGSGGILLSIPFLSSLAPSEVLANTPRVSRFVSVLRRDGAPLQFWPKLNFTDLTKLSDTAHAFDLAKIQGDLSFCFGSKFDQFRNEMIILKSLNGMEKYGDHGSSAILGAMNYKKSDYHPEIGPYETIDHRIIEKVYQSKPFSEVLNICLSWSTKRMSYSHKFDESGKIMALPTLYKPSTIFNQYFGNLNIKPDTNSNNDKNLVIDKVLEHLNLVKNNRKLSINDKKTLDKFSEEIFDVQKSINNTTSDLSCSIPIGMESYSNLEERVKQTFTLMSLALRCDLTRVINFDFNPDVLLQSIIQFNGKQHHGLSHSNNTDTVKMFAEMHKWHHDFLSDFLKTLKAEDPLNKGQSYLENTLVLLSNEMGNQGNGAESGADVNHIRIDVPTILFGNVNDYFNTGRYIDYRNTNKPKNNRWYKPVGHSYNQLLTTIMNAYGVGHSEWEIKNTAGFGDYRGMSYNKSAPSIMTLGNKRDPLPNIAKK